MCIRSVTIATVPPRRFTMRRGKTARDRVSGATARNASNKSVRADFLKQSDADPKSFPSFTCNGKRNRNPNRET